MRRWDEGSKEAREGMINKQGMVIMNRKIDRKIMKCGMRKRRDECRGNV